METRDPPGSYGRGPVGSRPAAVVAQPTHTACLAPTLSPMRWIFGAHGQVTLGVILFIGSAAVWVYGTTLHGASLITLLFHVSMAALVFGAYGIVATGLGYRKTEQVETAVVENIESADTVTVGGSPDGAQAPPPSEEPPTNRPGRAAPPA